MLKKALSFLLALCMLMGVVMIPLPVFAIESEENLKEVPYTVENVDGLSYKVYKLKDVFTSEEIQSIIKDDKSIQDRKNDKFGVERKSLQSKQASIMRVEENRVTSNQDDGPADPIIQEKTKYKIDIQWTTYDLKPGIAPEGSSDEEAKYYIGAPIYMEIKDVRSGKVVARTSEATKAGEVYFYKTKDYFDPSRSDVMFWALIVPNTFKADIKIKTLPQGSAKDRKMILAVNQKAMPLYRAEYYTNESIPQIEVQRTTPENITGEPKSGINKSNLSENGYYSFGEMLGDGTEKPIYMGKRMDVDKYGTDTDLALQVSDAGGAKRVKMTMKAPGKTGYDKGPGTFTDVNNIKYHYMVTGDHLTPHIFTIRQDLKVKFDPNKAEWNGAEPGNEKEPKSYTIGHSMKLSEKWAGLGDITAPVAANINEKTIPKATVDGKQVDQEFKGWTLKGNQGKTYKELVDDKLMIYPNEGNPDKDKVIKEKNKASEDAKITLTEKKTALKESTTAAEAKLAEYQKLVEDNADQAEIDKAKQAVVTARKKYAEDKKAYEEAKTDYDEKVADLEAAKADTIDYQVITKDDTTFFAVYGPKEQGKVKVKYVDSTGTVIDEKYKFISKKDGKDEKENKDKLTLAEKYPT